MAKRKMRASRVFAFLAATDLSIALRCWWYDAQETLRSWIACPIQAALARAVFTLSHPQRGAE